MRVFVVLLLHVSEHVWLWRSDMENLRSTGQFSLYLNILFTLEKCHWRRVDYIL